MAATAAPIQPVRFFFTQLKASIYAPYYPHIRQYSRVN